VTAEDARPTPDLVPEEVRRQLIELAAAAIGRQSAGEIPRTLRPFAKFTPTARAKHGATQIWSAIASDDDFRDSLAAVVEAAMPELVEQVKSNEVPDDAEPVMAGAIRFLLRPDGWQRDLAELEATLAVEREQRASDVASVKLDAELDRLRAANAELSRARDALRIETETTVRNYEVQLGDLRKELRQLKGELGKAQKLARDTEERAAEAEANLVRTEQDATAASRRAGQRITALEAEIDALRKTGRAARDHDDVRLWLLLEQLANAAEGLRGMALARDPGVRPADWMSTDDSEAEARMSVLDGTALDRVLRGKHVHLIVDGYNVTKNGYSELTLLEQRTRLVTSLKALAAMRDIEVTIAFDGQVATSSELGTLPRHFRVRFSAKGQTADDLIRELLALEPPGRTVIVASSDKEVAASARSRRAWSVSAQTLLELIRR